jgi:hypothetical protein
MTGTEALITTAQILLRVRCGDSALIGPSRDKNSAIRDYISMATWDCAGLLLSQPGELSAARAELFRCYDVSLEPSPASCS